MLFLIVYLTVVGIFAAHGIDGYVACGDNNDMAVQQAISQSVDRLMDLRRNGWGWGNTPEAVLGLQLSAQKLFFGRNEAIQAMRQEIQNNMESMNLGKLALYVTAIQSCCLNPRNFSGTDLVERLRMLSHKQFRYNGKSHLIPYDRYYRFGLAVGALCVNKEPVSAFLINKILVGIDSGKVYSGTFTAHDVNQILLALQCVQGQNSPTFNLKRVKNAIRKLANYLKTKLNTDENGNTWIGNKFSSPSAVLALMESGKISNKLWKCKDIMDGLVATPETLEAESAFSQRLPALSGVSYLSLKKEDWNCKTSVPIPEGYEPNCDPGDPPTCKALAPATTPSSIVRISVTLIVYVDSPSAPTTKPSVNVTLHDVVKGSTLIEVMRTARERGHISFISTSTSWGESIRTVQGITADSAAREYWSLRDGKTGDSLSRGASSYVPTDGEAIAFRRMNW